MKTTILVLGISLFALCAHSQDVSTKSDVQLSDKGNPVIRMAPGTVLHLTIMADGPTNNIEIKASPSAQPPPEVRTNQPSLADPNVRSASPATNAPPKKKKQRRPIESAYAYGKIIINVDLPEPVVIEKERIVERPPAPLPKKQACLPSHTFIPVPTFSYVTPEECAPSFCPQPRGVAYLPKRIPFPVPSVDCGPEIRTGPWDYSDPRSYYPGVDYSYRFR